MRIGLQVIRFDWGNDIASHLKKIATTAEQAGFYSLWVMDHFFQMGDIYGEPESPMLEAYTTLGYIASQTNRIKIGALVTGNFYRYPGILVKMVSTLDVLSGGRAYLGIGAGWYEAESTGLGIPFPPLKERFERLEETLQIAKHMWKGDTTPYVGKYHHLNNPLNFPQPLSQPHPPILIGGEGEQKTFRLIAKYGDACNLFIGASLPSWGDWSIDRFKNHKSHITQKLAILRQHCDEIGRNYDEIEKTVLGTIQLNQDGMTPSAVIDLCHGLKEVGVNQVIFNMPNTHTIEPIEQFGADIIPLV